LKKAGKTRNLRDMNTTSYPSDLSIAQWNILEPLMPTKSSTGRPREYALHTIVNAIVYILYEGCRWRSLPKEYPPWQTVYYYFRLWRKDGTLVHIRQHLVAAVRQDSARKPEPTAGVIDTQTVKTASYAHRDAGYDGAKKIKGRKRSIITDTQGLMPIVMQGMTAQRKSRVANVALLPIHKVFCLLLLSCPLQVVKIIAVLWSYDAYRSSIARGSYHLV
jgi:putative transposase